MKEPTPPVEKPRRVEPARMITREQLTIALRSEYACRPCETHTARNEEGAVPS